MLLYNRALRPRKREGDLRCPLCGKPLVYHNMDPLPEDTVYHLDGTPEGKELEFIVALYEYCPHCGYISLNSRTEMPEQVFSAKSVVTQSDVNHPPLKP